MRLAFDRSRTGAAEERGRSIAAGVIFIDPDGRVLLLQRSPTEKNFKNHWAIPGGKADLDEDAEEAASRECDEELGQRPYKPRFVSKRRTPTGMDYYTFEADAQSAFVPKLNSEHTAYGWFSPSAPPSPLHPAVEKLLARYKGREPRRAMDEACDSDKLPKATVDYSVGKGTTRCENCTHYEAGTCSVVQGPINPKYWCKRFERKAGRDAEPGLKEAEEKGRQDGLSGKPSSDRDYSTAGTVQAYRKGYAQGKAEKAKKPYDWRERSANDSFALDRQSARSYDADGHLRVARTPISKANICEYVGREIPDSEKLGLDPNRKYRLLRDPEELKKAAETSNGKPVLISHVVTTADSHKGGKVAGALGTDAEFEEPYLYNSMSIWPREAIQGVEDGSQSQLSMAYRYDADMTPGTYKGESYDGVMRNIRFNHVALVPEGRAGSDVMVADEKPKVSFGFDSSRKSFRFDHGPRFGFDAVTPEAEERYRRAYNELKTKFSHFHYQRIDMEKRARAAKKAGDPNERSMWDVAQKISAEEHRVEADIKNLTAEIRRAGIRL